MSAQQKQSLKRLDLKVTFTTPAFLGDAEQQGAWRTPPFKALLRQWWRVVRAKSVNFDVARLHAEEGELFGNAWIEGKHCQSEIRIRLDSWSEGKGSRSLFARQGARGQAAADPALVYLGYGPVQNHEIRRSIAPGSESVRLSVLVPETRLPAIYESLQFANWFGTVGSRSRNGWGSFTLEGNGLDPADELPEHRDSVEEVSLPLEACLEQDWPHAIGYDEGRPLVWRTDPHSEWIAAMRKFTEIKKAFRGKLRLPQNGFGERHLLGYPVTRSRVQEWDAADPPGRFPSQLRFKVVTWKGSYHGIAVHLPCGLPSRLLGKFSESARQHISRNQLQVWRTVHGTLDELMKPLWSR